MGKEKEWGRRVQAAEERQDLIPVSHIVQMANPYTRSSLHDSNRILTQPAGISYPALTYFQTCVLIMPAASQFFLVITSSPSAIPTSEKIHTPT